MRFLNLTKLPPHQFLIRTAILIGFFLLRSILLFWIVLGWTDHRAIAIRVACQSLEEQSVYVVNSVRHNTNPRKIVRDCISGFPKRKEGRREPASVNSGGNLTLAFGHYRRRSFALARIRTTGNA